MDRLFKTIILIGFLIIIPFRNAEAENKIILVTNEWLPYTSQKIKGGGIVSEIISEAFKEAGLKIEYQYLPWLRAEAIVKKGEAYAIFPYLKTDERAKTYLFSAPLINASQKFFYIKKNIKHKLTWNKYKDLYPYKIGGTFGFWYVPVFKEAGLKFRAAHNDELGIKILFKGRIDLFAADELNGWAIIKKIYPKHIDDFTTTKKTLRVDEYRLMISQKYPDSASITEKFNKAIEVIKQNGVYSSILKNYKNLQIIKTDN